MTRRPDGIRGVTITGTGMYVPERVLTNHDLAKLVDTSDEWIVERTGIRERRIAAPDQASSDLALVACQRALDMAQVQARDIDHIIVATTTPALTATAMPTLTSLWRRMPSPVQLAFIRGCFASTRATSATSRSV